MKLRRNVAYEAIRRRILSGDYPPDSTLSEAALGKTFGISRTPVREALMRLQEEGLTTILPRRGAIVRILGVQEIPERAERVMRQHLRQIRAETLGAGA